MNDLQRQLASLHEALRDARHLDADERAALGAAVDDIRRVLDSSTDDAPGAQHGDALESAGLAEVPGVRVNISGCTNSCGQHHISDIGFFGLERRAHGRAAPGYQMLLGGHVGDMEIEFGDKASKLPAKSAPEAVVRIVGRFNEVHERMAGIDIFFGIEPGYAQQVGDMPVRFDLRIEEARFFGDQLLFVETAQRIGWIFDDGGQRSIR